MFFFLNVLGVERKKGMLTLRHCRLTTMFENMDLARKKKSKHYGRKFMWFFAQPWGFFHHGKTFILVWWFPPPSFEKIVSEVVQFLEAAHDASSFPPFSIQTKEDWKYLAIVGRVKMCHLPIPCAHDHVLKQRSVYFAYLEVKLNWMCDSRWKKLMPISMFLNKLQRTWIRKYNNMWWLSFEILNEESSIQEKKEGFATWE